MRVVCGALLSILLPAIAHAQPFSATAAYDQSPEGALSPGDRALRRDDPVFIFMARYTDIQPDRFGYQCVQGGSDVTRMRDWSDPVRINTDDGWGGCELKWAIVDPKNVLNTPSIKITFSGVPSGNSECKGAVDRSFEIPVTADRSRLTPSIIQDSDSNQKGNGCKLTFDVQTPDIDLNIQFWADDEGVDQCGNRLPYGQWHTAKLGKPVALVINTDNRYGGCKISFQLVPR